MSLQGKRRKKGNSYQLTVNSYTNSDYPERDLKEEGT